MLAALIALVQLLGAVTAVRAVMEARTAQGATAWAVALIAFPWLALPLFWVFGQSKFRDYVLARKADLARLDPLLRQTHDKLAACGLLARTEYTRRLPFEKLVKLPFTTGNDAELLIDGEASFASMFAGIGAARAYVLVQFYIIRADEVGRALQALLVQRARAGVRVHLLYDELGSYALPRDYLDALRSEGVEVRAFHAIGPGVNRLHLNFRNHRKIVVVDGREAWIGGVNVGEEYLGRAPRLGYWRDTHLRVEGPVVQCAQVAFMEDWHWAAAEMLALDWDPQPAASGARRAILCLPSGPADELETCTLFFIAAITEAKSRLWIASPYFVPDGELVTALQLAALRGVDVRILIPDRADNPIVDLSAWSYIEELEKAGIAVYRFGMGFMHQKVSLIDDDWCTIGTVNFDNRSFRLNFEITMAVVDRETAARVHAMLDRDFASARRVTSADLRSRSFAFRFAVRAARLSAPVQ
jgi:cardiolipin synthase